MARIRIVTDSASDLPPELANQRDIVVVPLEVRLGDTSAEEMRNLSTEQFWQKAKASDALAETAAPSPGAFQEAFLQAKGDYDAVCCVTISSDLSATYQSALNAARAVESEIPVQVVDSRFATMGEGLLVLEASSAAKNEGSLDDVVGCVQSAIERTTTFGTLNTLEYLRRGGRIGSAQAFLGSLLAIKPVVEVRNGVVEGESKQRTRARSFQYLSDKVHTLGPLRRCAVVHADAQDLDAFVALLADVVCDEPLIVSYIGPVIGAHTGPGTVGVCCQQR